MSLKYNILFVLPKTDLNNLQNCSTLTLERLPRFAIYLAIGIGVTFFGMFLFSILPHMIENTGNDWERAIGGTADSEEEIMALLMVHPSYIAFYETYPDAKEEFENRSRGNGNLSVGIMDFETGDQIILELRYDKRDDRVRVDVRCNIMGDEDNRRNDNFRAEGLFAEDFIRNVDCLNTIVTTPQIESISE